MVWGGVSVRTCGALSYGLYLVHQPYVIWLGLRIREVPIGLFLLICIPVLAVHRLGDGFGKWNKHAGEQARLSQKKTNAHLARNIAEKRAERRRHCG